ncbi:L,D-transpeptidase [Calothrix sp. 336/3]|uniref:L,D-transpeptidase n=1 Tax=Calothrix sp. 336/3 TaxID=1337936 RepID=UPI0004E2BAE3|nr:L,D-transpeptidase [Calothrix sp. 336/3]AKG19928.1 ErfK/YbiS/YcfS/YnhG family protein [Calothrix sp. 336/3]
MAMVRNESLARVVMLLCFVSGILSLVLHWQITNSMTPKTHSPKVAKNPAHRTNWSQQSANLLDNKKNHSSAQGTSSAFWQKNPSLKTTDMTVPMEVVIDLSDRRVYVYRRGQVIASYPTGIGKKGWETPTGNFQVINKQLHPSWRHPITGKVFPAGEDSPLGDRWIGFWSNGREQIGFHGTPDDSLVGMAVSHGCLRMRNPDVRLLYKQIGIGTPVAVRD